MKDLRRFINGSVFKLLILAALIKVFLFWWGYDNFNFNTYPAENWLTIWNRWDSKAYLTLAEEWYRAPSVDIGYRNFLSHFPPFYPAAILAVSLITGLSTFYSAVYVSFVSIILASYFLYKLVMLEFGDRNAAFYAVLLMNVYPTSYFTVAPYAESIYLFLAVASFYYLRKSSYAAAGLLGMCGILTRLQGIALYPSYVIYIIKKIPWYLLQTMPTCDLLLMPVSILSILKKIFSRWKAIFFLLLTPVLGVLIYLCINAAYYGGPAYFMEEYKTNIYSAKMLIVPGEEVFDSANKFLINSFTPVWDDQFMMTLGWGAVFTVTALFTVFLGVYQKIPLEYTAYSLSSIIFFASYSWGISNARYSLAAFPMFIVLSRIKDKTIVKLIAAVFFILLLYFTKIYTSGVWAF